MVCKTEELSLEENLVEEELRCFSEFKREEGHYELKCGCTSRKYGDTIGKLWIFDNGHFMVSCQCSQVCQGKSQKLTPYEFEKHSGKEGTRNWTKHIWVVKDGHKKALGKTMVVTLYKHKTNEANCSSVFKHKRIFHRDEFLRCSICNKDRRFRLRTREDCRIYHDASLKQIWNCADWPYDKISCNDDEERASRKICRGCPRSPTCKGCSCCVCFGCYKCRFFHCKCDTCDVYMHKGQP
ncbi:hypothetical protein CFOL_v3_28805 [Cephalotus follicularis]|uniref:Uncharacterized protein n=1 Tax=Cephalotus follicularis TaxID=3775 RepID=A0A1Q3CYQ2_CEPFO|nr:hypothetical protein CFOL_v3_28805 [Cephalotus follicularis]